MVPRVIFGRGSFSQINEVLASKRLSPDAPFIFLIDAVFKGQPWITSRIQLSYDDSIIFVSSKEEPKTEQVDQLVEAIILSSKARPSGIIGVGGGSLLDLAKAVSIMITNSGESKDYQGWDLVKNPAVYHVGIPTISGTGAEISRTALLTGPDKKLGINSDFTPFDQVILDSELTKGVPKDQWFYTGMDCFIHCVESLSGTYLSPFSETYSTMAYELCKKIFLESPLNTIKAQENLMMASWHGGMSIAYSQVGVAHALSYGLSHVMGIKHGIGNCIVFNQLEAYYPNDVKIFKQMVDVNNIYLPQNVCSDLSDLDLNKMITIALSLEPLWENALGKNWRQIITTNKLRALYLKM